MTRAQVIQLLADENAADLVEYAAFDNPTAVSAVPAIAEFGMFGWVKDC